jgi:urease accessory protein
MSAVISLSERAARPETRDPVEAMTALGRVRVRGGVSVAVSAADGRSRVDDVFESDGYKVRFPRRGARPEAILINTGGGLAAGDRVRLDFKVGDGAGLTVTTQASERVYRAPDEATTEVAMRAELGAEATLAWLPQDTILFDHARLRRTITVDMAASASLLAAETIVLGRTRMGEWFRDGLFADAWRIRRDGRLAFAENIRLDRPGLGRLTEPALAGPAPVIVTAVLVAPDAEDKLGSVRNVLSKSPFTCAASAWNGMLVVRGLAAKTELVRNLMSALVPVLGAGPLPRTWWT